MLQERNMSASRLQRLIPEKGLPGRLQHPRKLLHNCVKTDDYDTLKWLLKFDEGKRRQLLLKHVAYSNVYRLFPYVYFLHQWLKFTEILVFHLGKVRCRCCVSDWIPKRFISTRHLEDKLLILMSASLFTCSYST